jgi:hypothetical protein
MSDAERTEVATDGDEHPVGGAPGAGTVSVDGRTVSVDLPADADGEEAAAIATAVGAHLRDRAQAAAVAAGADDEGPGQTDEWTLATRMKAVGKCRWPDDVERGEEWKAAARSFY